VVCLLCMGVCVCVCMGFCLTQIKIDWLIDWLMQCCCYWWLTANVQTCTQWKTQLWQAGTNWSKSGHTGIEATWCSASDPLPWNRPTCVKKWCQSGRKIPGPVSRSTPHGHIHWCCGCRGWTLSGVGVFHRRRRMEKTITDFIFRHNACERSDDIRWHKLCSK